MDFIRFLKKSCTCYIVLGFTYNITNAASLPNHFASAGDLLVEQCRALRQQVSITHETTEKNPKKYWVLSLDGGGVRGLMHLKTLAKLEEQTEKPVSQLFDAVAGTSIVGL